MARDLLEVRKLIKKRKPTFRRVQANQFAKFKNDPKWRRPKGMGNKDRRNRKGHIGMLKIGYSSPRDLRGANSNGLFEVLVNNVSDLESIDSKTQIAVIASSVGKKKRIDILSKAKSLKVKVSGVDSYDDAIKALTPKKNQKKSDEKKVEKKKEDKVEDDSSKKSSTQKKSSNTGKSDKKEVGGNEK